MRVEYREFGRTGWKISAIGFGTWAIGSAWGPVDERAPMAALHRALDLGVNFFDTADVFGRLDDLAAQGKIRYYGVSVERVAEALKAIEYPHVQSVQIIFNIFRQKPAEEFFSAARRRRVGILARVPLASGLLTGKMTKNSAFPQDDHRNFNRHGEAFDRGETFSGVDFEEGLAAVEELRPLVPVGASMAQLALRWILMFDAVSGTIPGAKNPAQVEDNVRAADLRALPDAAMARRREIYDRSIRGLVRQNW